jgi:tRNA dimethylallyltransferase
LSLRLLIAIVGPTAVGKTALSIKLAGRLNTEIISADSRQFYREMEIGTAKPSLAELKKIPHHFINTLSITNEYNVGKYEKEAVACLDEIFSKHEIVIMVGGSGLFVNAVCHGFDALPQGDPELRKHYENVLQQEGIEPIQRELMAKDPVYYEAVDRNNPRRLIRALEVFHQTGKPYSQFRKKKIQKRNFEFLKIGLEIDRKILRERIDKRVDEMLAAGWLEECKKLLTYKNLNALKTVGYTELFEFLEQKCDWETAVQNIKTNTWHYAKRQLTWFKKDKEIKWFGPKDEESILNSITFTLYRNKGI